MLCGLVLGLWSCAQISAPTGGPKDETPPQVIVFDPPNERVNIRPHQLLMEFDEYVVVRNVQQMLIVSPPIAKAPTWRVRGKKIEWTFDPAEFAEDRTYVFSFGSSIVDLHESNPATDLKWAFSTGSDLDTLRARGNVIDRMTGQGKKGLRVLLFHAPQSGILFGQANAQMHWVKRMLTGRFPFRIWLTVLLWASHWMM